MYILFYISQNILNPYIILDNTSLLQSRTKQPVDKSQTPCKPHHHMLLLATRHVYAPHQTLPPMQTCIQ